MTSEKSLRSPDGRSSSAVGKSDISKALLMVGPAQLRSWRRRLALSEEQCRLRHAAFCAKYPTGLTDIDVVDDDDNDDDCDHDDAI